MEARYQLRQSPSRCGLTSRRNPTILPSKLITGESPFGVNFRSKVVGGAMLASRSLSLSTTFEREQGDAAVSRSTDLKIGVGGHVVALDPPVSPGAVPIDTDPGAVGQPTEQSPILKGNSHETAGANSP